MPFNPMETVSHICIGVASVALGGWILFQLPWRMSVAFMLLCSVAMVPLNLLHPTIPDHITAWQEPRIIFHTLKGITVALSVAFLLSYPALFRRFDKAPVLIVTLLALNIIEALFAEGRKDFTVNILSGILLIALIPAPDRVSVVTDGNRERVSLPVDWIWILIYGLWNFAFLLQITGQGRWIVFGFSQILAPLLLIRLVPGRFIEARAVTLFTATLLWQLHGIYDPMFAAPDLFTEREVMIPIRSTGFAIQSSSHHGIPTESLTLRIRFTVFLHQMKILNPLT